MEKIHLYDKIISPMVTEKSTNLSEQNKVVFKVAAGADKVNLKKNIEKIFKVNVTKINIINKQNTNIFFQKNCSTKKINYIFIIWCSFIFWFAFNLHL